MVAHMMAAMEVGTIMGMTARTGLIMAAATITEAHHLVNLCALAGSTLVPAAQRLLRASRQASTAAPSRMILAPTTLMASGRTPNSARS